MEAIMIEELERILSGDDRIRDIIKRKLINADIIEVNEDGSWNYATNQ